jgi:radical SAM protein with 4Fe4S-binding SPASM domain
VADTVLFGQLEDREKAVLQTCASCAFLDLCYSGCMFHSLKDSKVLAEKDYL